MSATAIKELPVIQAGGAPPTFDDVESALAKDVRMFINSHAGDIKVVNISEEGDVELAFSGACGKCPALSSTFAIRVLPAVRAVPGVRNVSADNIHVSEAALERVARIFGHKACGH
jgi:Fe-S cluster biogenesis protein NfuA